VREEKREETGAGDGSNPLGIKGKSKGGDSLFITRRRGGGQDLQRVIFSITRREMPVGCVKLTSFSS
jgi:hypothetical protein